MSSQHLDDGQSVRQSLSVTTGDDTIEQNGHSLDPAAAVAVADALDKHLAQPSSALDVHMAARPPPPPPPSSSDMSSCTARSTTSASPLQFRSYTFAPSPRVPAPGPRARSPNTVTHEPTELWPQIPHSTHSYATPARPIKRPDLGLHRKSSTQSLHPISRTPSLKTGSFYGPFGSASAASSTVASPVISAMGEVTPLPSPLLASDSPGPWKQLARRESRETPFFHSPLTHSDPADSPIPSRSTKKPFAVLTPGPEPTRDTTRSHDGVLPHPRTHTRNRSTSEYIPDPMLIPKRMSTVSGTRPKPNITEGAEGQGQMRREPHLGEARGLPPIEKPPTPPPSESSQSGADPSLIPGFGSRTGGTRPGAEYFEAYGRYDQKRRRWRSVRVLGQGTFSQTMKIAVQAHSNQIRPPIPDRRSLVAVKICEHGPRGGASEDRIEMSLKRELEIMQSIRHPSLVHLKAWSIEPSRAILVLSYYPGGDLFDVATRHRDVLTPVLIRRMFSELVGAVTYLHDQKIVHRDIKLENLGLSRRVASHDERLETRCGSDDYAAPEVIMGQPYDGRATDAWSVGVLLYALLEARLPFDPPPAGPAGLTMPCRCACAVARAIALQGSSGEGEE
ncbi:hypothetical protein N0V88_002208 [Collariella sp. IMI 366227]|nr:hypothetical protein N0V88_002208 [Collariella sp. IMI 366227]